MKTIAYSFFALCVGIAVGYHFERRYAKTRTESETPPLNTQCLNENMEKFLKAPVFATLPDSSKYRLTTTGTTEIILIGTDRENRTLTIHCSGNSPRIDELPRKAEVEGFLPIDLKKNTLYIFLTDDDDYDEPVLELPIGTNEPRYLRNLRLPKPLPAETK